MRPFFSFLVKRVIYLFIVLFATLIITIGLLAPFFETVLKSVIADKIRNDVLTNPKYRYLTEAEREALIKTMTSDAVRSMGLDQPWYSPTRLYNTIVSVMSLDLGRTSVTYASSSGTHSVHDLIMERLPRTVLLFGSATIIVSVIGIYLGSFVAGREGSLPDRVVSAVTVLSSSFPTWWVGILMILVFAFVFRIFPAQSIPQTLPSDPRYIPDLLYHMALPLITLVVMGFGVWAYSVRYFVSLMLVEDFIRAKRTAGIPESKILYSHALKNAAPAIFTSVALSLAASFGGAILVETVFDWPGMGLLYIEAIGPPADMPVIIGLTYVSTLIFVITIFAIDLAYGYFDPRLKVSGEKAA
ncbi:MAG TPA: ABC transporter permease [Nitrososphaera sp.]|nr:ABC transporter permease [Nitrososphaera sp.]